MTEPPSDFQHRLFLYQSDDEFIDVVLPFLEEGLEVGESVVVAAGPALSELIRLSLPPDSPVIFDLEYSLPIATIESRRRMVAELVGEGARAVRMVGEVPHPGIGEQPWEPWAQYEAVINHVYADLPLTGLCVYDRRTLPEEILEDVLSVHPVVVDSEGVPERQDCFKPPGHFLRQQGCRPDALDQRESTVELRTVADLRLLRRTLHHRAAEAGLLGPVIDDFVLAVNEVASDALSGGAHPVTVRSRLSAERLLTNLSHPGPGPDPLDGFLLPDGRIDGRLGIPIARRFARQVDICPGPESRIRLVAYPDVSTSRDDRAITQTAAPKPG